MSFLIDGFPGSRVNTFRVNDVIMFDDVKPAFDVLNKD